MPLSCGRTAITHRHSSKKDGLLNSMWMIACRQQPRLRSMLDMDLETPVLPFLTSREAHSLEDAARVALGED